MGLIQVYWSRAQLLLFLPNLISRKMLHSGYKWPNHSNHDLFAFQAHRPAHLIKKNCIQTRNRKNKKEMAGVQKALLEQLPPMLI